MITRTLVAAGSLVDRIKINQLFRIGMNGRWFWFKRRRTTAPLIISLANWFFRCAGNPVTILAEPAHWMDWEQTCLATLHGDRFEVVVDSSGTLGVEEFPGRSLSDHLDDGTATPAMAAAAGRELLRAHLMTCREFPEGWSHGDPHTGNFMYDASEDRARLMDFEVRHHKALAPAHRHADDLLVFLQDTLGRMPQDAWLHWAQTFLAAYDRPEVTAHLVDRLTAPQGLARLWWAVRTTYMGSRELNCRLAALRAVLVS